MDDKDFKAFRIYIKVANALERNPIVVYYLKTYAINKALEYLKIQRKNGNDVSSLVDEVRGWLQGLEELKDTLTAELADKDRCKKVFKDFTFNLYEESEVDYRNGNLGRGLAKNFLYVSVLFDAWELFGGQDDNIKAKKTYANEARFKIMDIIQKELNSRHKSNNEEALGPKKDTLNLLAKLDFDLVESIYVPQSHIDRFLNSPPHERLCPPSVWETFSIRPVQNALTTNNVAPQWNIPMGTSVRLDSTDMQEEEKPKRGGFIPGIPVGTSMRLDDEQAENMNVEKEEKEKKVGFKGIPMGTSVRLESSNKQKEEKPKKIGFIPGIPVGTSVRIDNEPIEEVKFEEEEKPNRKSSNGNPRVMGMRIETNNQQVEEKPRKTGFIPGIPVGTSVRIDDGAVENTKMEEEKGKENPITPTFTASPRENIISLDIMNQQAEEKPRKTGFIPGIPVGTSVRIEDTPVEDNKIEEEKPKKVGIYGIPIGTSVRIDGPVEDNKTPNKVPNEPENKQKIAELLKAIPLGTSLRLENSNGNLSPSTMECEVPKIDQPMPSFLQIPQSQYLTPTVSQLNSKLNYVSNSNQVSSRASEPPRSRDYFLLENMPVCESTEYKAANKPGNSPDQQQRLINQRDFNDFNEELKSDFDFRVKRSYSGPPATNVLDEQDREKDKERIVSGCKEVQEYCLKAVSELGNTNVRNAKESILKALRLLEQLE